MAGFELDLAKHHGPELLSRNSVTLVIVLSMVTVGCGTAEVAGDRAAEMAAANAAVLGDPCAAVPASLLGHGGFDEPGRRETSFLFDGCVWRAGPRQLSARVNAGEDFARSSMDDPRGRAIGLEGADVAVRYEVHGTDGQGMRLEIEAVAERRSVMVEIVDPSLDADDEVLAVAVAEAVIAGLR